MRTNLHKMILKRKTNSQHKIIAYQIPKHPITLPKEHPLIQIPHLNQNKQVLTETLSMIPIRAKRHRKMRNQRTKRLTAQALLTFLFYKQKIQPTQLKKLIKEI